MRKVRDEREGPRSPDGGEFAEDGVEAVELGACLFGNHAAVVRAAERLGAAHGHADDNADGEILLHRVDEVSVDDDAHPEDETEDDGLARTDAVSNLAKADGAEDGDELNDEQRQHQGGGREPQLVSAVDAGHVDHGLNALVVHHEGEQKDDEMAILRSANSRLPRAADAK